jgi:hypothetical protein
MVVRLENIHLLREGGLQILPGVAIRVTRHNAWKLSNTAVIRFRDFTENCPEAGYVKTQFISILFLRGGYNPVARTGMVKIMCMTTMSTLTLTGLLQDPLTKLVMRSDGVSEEDFSALLQRVQDSLIARSALPRLETGQLAAGWLSSVIADWLWHSVAFVAKCMQHCNGLKMIRAGDHQQVMASTAPNARMPQANQARQGAWQTGG